MEIKLTVSIGATLQLRNANGDWDWIKPEVGCELKLLDGEIEPERLPDQFSIMWDNVVAPQFQTIVENLLEDQVPTKVESSDEYTDVVDVFRESVDEEIAQNTNAPEPEDVIDSSDEFDNLDSGSY